MHINEYQELALKTFTNSPEDSALLLISRLTLGLVGESGEVAEKVKKLLRGDNSLDDSAYKTKFKETICKELGDVMWYIAVLAAELDLDLETIVHENVLKLTDRKKRNVIKGSGDNR